MINLLTRRSVTGVDLLLTALAAGLLAHNFTENAQRTTRRAMATASDGYTLPSVIPYFRLCQKSAKIKPKDTSETITDQQADNFFSCLDTMRRTEQESLHDALYGTQPS